MGLDFISAVELLSNEKAIPFHSHSISKAEPPKNREITLHESTDLSRTMHYLHNGRGLSIASLEKLTAEGRLSQEGKTGNAVFKIFDENGLLVGAEKVGTSNVRFKSFDKGAADGYGFEIVSGKPANTYFFESAIDAVSFADLYPERRDYRLVSMAGVKPSVVTETMQRYAISPENIYLCTDNDKTGNEFAEKLIARYPAMKRVTPNGAKDWNDILQGRMNKMKRYGNPYWQEATDNRDKTVAVMREDTFQQIQQALDKSGLNYCAYSDGSNTMIAVNSSEIDHFKNVTGLDESLCRLQKSGKEHIPQDKNVIGNTDYKYIPQKSYISEDRETILKMAELANKANISFSARIYPSGKGVMTVSQADISQISAIQDAVKVMRKPMIQNSRQASQEIIGNRPYREIRNRQFMISPLTPDKYHKMEPKLYERGAEFSGLIRDGKVMFTTEKEDAPHFQAILRQTICENQILENLQNMGLDNQQIQALSSSIEIAARNNMANVIENYVSKDYDITQLGTMNDLLIGYLDQSNTSQFLDNSRKLDLLLSAKQEFDLQIAQREELVSVEEIDLPESPAIATTEDYLADKAQSTELSDLDIAKQHIADYYDREFGELAEFSDLSNISLAYTTDEEHNLPIQVYADLEQYRLIFEYDGNVVRDEQYNSLAEMNENALSVLDFNDLVSLSDDEIASVIPTKASDLPFKVGDDIEFQGKEWHIDSINEDRGRIMLSRDTGNVIMPQEGLETFLSEVVESANHHAGIENLEQMDTTIKEKSAETEISDDAPLFSENAIADAGLGFIADDKEFKPFGNGKKEYEQLTLFGESEPVNSSASAQAITPVQYGEPVADVNRFEELHKEIMRGSGFEGGKFRIAEFFQENNPSNQEFADFLKNEYGTGGHTADGNIFSVDHDSKGIHFTLRSVDNGISKETFDFSWTEVAKLTADLIQHDKYITQKDIDRRNRRGSKTEKSDIKPENIAAPDEKLEQQIKADEKTQNFTITDDNLGEGGAKTKFKNNLLAIQTLKQIESEDRTATPEEQEILSKYVGWGGLAQAFDSENEQWSKEFAQLSDALTPKEYEDARKSVLDSFFTSPAIIDGIYEALDKFGFNGGNLLEPSCGVGNFLGKMPSEMAEHTNIYGVEIDSISGRIAKQLYPDADIQITGFENTHFQNGSFDAAVGNVPFGDLNFPDKQYGTTKLHDFFFAQTLDKVKKGGIVAFVTSKGTLDKKDESFRMQLAQKADLIGAVRLPNSAFKANAGTEVTSDIIFLQKRSAPPEGLPDWVHLGKTEDGLRVNSYFAENPEMVLGTIVEGNKLYGRNDDTMCIPIEGADLRQQIHEAVQKLDTQISAVKTNEVFKFSDKQVTMTATELRPFSFFKDDKGDIYLKGGESKLGNFDVSKVMDTKSKDYDRMTAFIDLRDTVRELLKVQADDRPENEIKAVQQKLSVQYDDFYKKYGLLHSRKNRQVLRDDCSYNLLLTLEKEFDKDKLIAKSDIFTKRTVRPSKPIEHVDTALEALAISMAETAKVDLEYMSKLTDMSQELLIAELKGEIFLVPNTEEYQSASEYLSGDICQKLDIAAAYAESDSRFAENVTVLEKAMPEPLKAGDIDVKIGATWIPKELYQQFMYELFQTPRENREDVKKAFWVKPKNITVDYSEHTNTWHIENKRADSSVLSRRDFGTKNMSAYEIMEQLLNLKEPKVYKSETYLDLNGNEKERRVVDIKATKIVQQKAAKIKQAFKDWIFRDPERAIPLVEQYNRQFNSIRPREYDGSALRFPGMNSAITLKEHQKNAIAHALFGGNTLFAHCVGAGKTFEMIATAMESKRLGLCTKPLFAVPNHLTEQIGEDFQKLYPGSNILVATKSDFKKENRQQLFSKIATGDFDAVIIGHSQLGMIPLSKERQVSILRDQIDDIMAGIEELKKAEGSRFQVKQMERTKKSLEARLDKLEKTHDDILTFEEMGIDKLIIDEAHEFKNVPTQTKLTNVAGISSSASQKALDLFMKCRYLDEKTGSRGVIMATGTPLSNSVTELHTMMRFLEYDFLKDHGLSNFDNWVTVFGEQKTEWELAPAGNKFKERTRIANYTGLPELMSMFKQVADVRTADTLDLATPEMKYHIENIEATGFQKTLVQELSDRADDVQSGNVDPSVDNMLRITSDGRKLGLDPRLIDPSFEDSPDTKLNQCVRNVTQIYHDTAEEKLTQIIFCDLGVPKKNSQSTDKGENADEKSASERESLEEECDFCVYDDIRDKLIVNGIKPDEIAYVHDAKTEQQKADLFDRVNKGEVRVLLGSTGKMGTGTNCQKKLIALHNLDIPWRPSDLQQRIGRIERQGNQNSVAHVFNYVTKGSFDAYLYQTLEAKQRFIGQIMTSKTPARTCEDVDQQALNYSEIKALCTGDERIKEKMMLDNEVKELNLLKAEHTNTVFDMQQTVAVTPAKIENAEIRLENLKADRETLRQLPIDEETKLPVFKITIDGTEYTDRKEAAQALEDAVLDFVKKSSDSEKEIGEFQGFKLSVKAVMFGNEPDISITMKGNAEHKCALTSSFSANLKRMESTLYKIDQTISDAQNNINKLKMNLENARRIVNTPFPQQAELEQKTERLASLTDELNQAAIEAKKNAPEKQRTCYFERAKLKKEAFKDRQKTTKPKERSQDKNEIE
ncbi:MULTISPECIES: toprim domain-containing protein [Ruminococcus]|uniref:toprim domain-containing protein n=1 Tax=Ruminococcus TaxID=1263 RepID=UPI0015F31433|nr:MULTISPECIES: toprim domain-containing protein [Ruminococcus]